MSSEERIWEIPIDVDSNFCCNVEWSPDNQLLAVASSSSEIAVYSFKERSLSATVLLEDRSDFLSDLNDTLAWSPDSHLLAIGTTDGLRMWNSETRELSSYPTTYFVTGPSLGVTILAVKWSPDGQQLAAWSSNEILWILELQECGLQIVREEKEVPAKSSFDWYADESGTLLAIGVKVDLQLIDTKNLDHTIGRIYVPISAVRFNSNGSLVATGTESGRVVIWDIQSGGRVYDIPETGHAIQGLRFLLEDQSIATTYSDGSLLIWDLGAQAEGHQLLAGIPGWHGGHFLATNDDILAFLRISSTIDEPGNLLSIWDVRSRNLVGEISTTQQ